MPSYSFYQLTKRIKFLTASFLSGWQRKLAYYSHSKHIINYIKQFAMQLVLPDLGLVFWMLLSFLIVMFVLRKFAWKPILNALHEREHYIGNALKMAEKAKQEMAKLQADSEKLIQEAKNEREKLLTDARIMREKLLEEAKARATEESEKIIISAKQKIENEKLQAINQIKEQVAILSIEIAEKILIKKLEDDKNQKELVNKYLDQIQLFS